MSNFEATLNRLGYAFKEKIEGQLVYQKKLTQADLVLVFDLARRSISPILVPSQLIIHKDDIDKLGVCFRTLQEDAEYLQKLTKNYIILT